MRCEVCGNDYYKTFQVVIADEVRVFDSFECAIHALAPQCAHCGCRVIGHGEEVEGRIFCCHHCAANASGVGRSERKPKEDPVERASEESFPASDPPAWTADVGMGRAKQSGRVGYLVLYLLGAPVGLLLLLWVLLGNNLFAPG
jgi:hypothetical protein